MKLSKSEALGEITATIPGFGTKTFKIDFEKSTHISALVNLVFADYSCHENSKSSWSWGDIPHPEDGCYTLSRITEKVFSVKEIVDNDAVGGTVKNTIYQQYILKIFPERWELYESEYTEKIPQGGWKKVNISSDSIGIGGGSHWTR